MTALIVLPLALAWFLLPAQARQLGPLAQHARSAGEALRSYARTDQTVAGGAQDGTAQSLPPGRRPPTTRRATAASATTAAPATTGPPRTSQGGSAPSSTGATPTKRAETVADRITQELFSRLNAEREARGLAALTWDPSLARMADGWSRHMASTADFSHRDLSAASSLPGISKFSALGENIAWVEGYPNESYQLHTGWMHSEGHRSNMLQPGFDSVGIAVVCSDGRAWATQNFGRLDASKAPAMTSDTPAEDPVVGTGLDGLRC